MPGRAGRPHHRPVRSHRARSARPPGRRRRGRGAASDLRGVLRGPAGARARRDARDAVAGSAAVTAGRPLTIVAPITDGMRDELAGKLAQIRDGITTNAVLQPAALPDTHFTRWLILADPHPEPHRDLLVWETNHDGDPLEYLTAVVAAVPVGIDALFGCCDRYPGGAATEPLAVVDLLRAPTDR